MKREIPRNNIKASAWITVTIIAVCIVLGIFVAILMEAHLKEKVKEDIGKLHPPLPEEESEYCRDSDGGLNYFKKGRIIIHEDIEKEDSCEGDEVVEEFCEGGVEASKKYKCPTGCEDGACKEEEYTLGTCVDSDGGKNYFSPGTTYNTTETEYDRCIVTGGMSVLLQEFYCEKKEDEEVYLIKYTVYQCPNGCEEGRCVE